MEGSKNTGHLMYVRVSYAYYLHAYIVRRRFCVYETDETGTASISLLRVTFYTRRGHVLSNIFNCICVVLRRLRRGVTSVPRTFMSAYFSNLKKET